MYCVRACACVCVFVSCYSTALLTAAHTHTHRLFNKLPYFLLTGIHASLFPPEHVCSCVRALVCVCGYTNVCKTDRQTDRQTELLLQLLLYFSLSYVISAVTVECIMKGMRPAMHKFYRIDCDSSYVFRLVT